MGTRLVYTENGGGDISWSDIDGLYVNKDNTLIAVKSDGTQVVLKQYLSGYRAKQALASINADIEGGVEVIVIDDY